MYARHYLRLLLALRGSAGLVVHEPGTRAWLRRLLVLAAARAGPHRAGLTGARPPSR